MAKIRAVRTEADYDAALARIDELFHSEPASPEGEELDVLIDLVEHYEDRHYPIEYPSAVGAMDGGSSHTAGGLERQRGNSALSNRAAGCKSRYICVSYIH